MHVFNHVKLYLKCFELFLKNCVNKSNLTLGKKPFNECPKKNKKVNFFRFPVFSPGKTKLSEMK